MLNALPPAERGSPFVQVVAALLARDRGDDATARGLLASAARAFRTRAMAEALARPPREWPGLRPLTAGLLSPELLEEPGVRWTS